MVGKGKGNQQYLAQLFFFLENLFLIFYKNTFCHKITLATLMVLFPYVHLILNEN